jgi:hypothetical protein
MARASAIDPVEPPPPAIAFFAAASLIAGLGLLSGGPFAFSPQGALDGVASQLSTTLPAVVLVAAASGLNLAAGMVVIRSVSRRPLEGASGAIVGGFVGAVLLDLVLLGALGGTGLFRWPILLLVHLGVLAWGWRLRPILRDVRPGAGDWWPLWVVVLMCWLGLVALQLASPVVPFVDVLPNHVAPVEHLRSFGDFASLTTTASPIYGPSRTFLGYVALLGVVDTLSGLPAGLGVAAFALPGAVAVSAGLHRLGTALGGRRTGTWAVVAFILTTSFVRLPDARATVLVLPLTCWCLAVLADRLAARDASPEGEGPALGDTLLLGGGVAAAILFHPVIGALTALAIGLVTLALPGRVGHLATPALGSGAILALPQLAAMVGLAVPTVLSLLVIPAALGAGWLVHRATALRRALLAFARVVFLGVILASLVLAAVVVPAAYESLARILPTMPVLLATVLAGVLLAPGRFRSPVLLASLVAGAIAATATELAPAQGTLLTALRFEVPKTLHYWIPVVVALAAAIALDSLWSDERLRRPGALPAGTIPRLVLLAFAALAILPLRQEPLTDAYFLGERRVSETVSLQLRYAETGYWRGYPDARRIVAPEQVALLDAVRAEIAAGRLGPGSEVLHVAHSFQQWSAVPLGVFAGVIETDVTPDAEVSIHTVGGRLRPFDQLAPLLGQRLTYVMLEPAGLPDGTRAAIIDAGYRSIFANGLGELFAGSG